MNLPSSFSKAKRMRYIHAQINIYTFNWLKYPQTLLIIVFVDENNVIRLVKWFLFCRDIVWVIYSDHGVSRPSGLVRRTQVLVLSECGWFRYIYIFFFFPKVYVTGLMWVTAHNLGIRWILRSIFTTFIQTFSCPLTLFPSDFAPFPSFLSFSRADSCSSMYLGYI